MSRYPKLNGLIAATFTPLRSDGTLNPKGVDAQVDHFLSRRVSGVFIGGTTGECHSLTVEERLALARRWAEVTRGTPLKCIMHVGHHALPDARRLAMEAERLGVHGISALAPGYFKPATLSDLVDVCGAIAGAAPSLPFYYYDIPAMTGVVQPMPEFLELALERIPTLAGLKFTNPDFISLQRCLHLAGESVDVVYGSDECLMAAWAFGVRGFVGSTYNHIAPVARRIMGHLERGEWAEARVEQMLVVEFVRLCARRGYLPAAKAAMGFLGLNCGPVRSPLHALDPAQISELREELDQAGFNAWIH